MVHRRGKCVYRETIADSGIKPRSVVHYLIIDVEQGFVS